MLKAIPIERMMIETDAPWCEIKNTSAGKPHVQTQWEAVKKERHVVDKCVKNRCEPCHIRQVLEVVGAVHGVVDLDHLAATLYANTCRVFFPDGTG